MEVMNWVGLAALVAVVATGWFFVVPLIRSWKAPASPARRTFVPKDGPTTLGGGTAFGRLSTIR